MQTPVHVSEEYDSNDDHYSVDDDSDSESENEVCFTLIVIEVLKTDQGENEKLRFKFVWP